MKHEYKEPGGAQGLKALTRWRRSTRAVRGRTGRASVAFFLMLAGCGDTMDCPDCGGCGIAGPVNGDLLVVTRSGTDAAGVPAVQVVTWLDGTCKGEPAPTVWVHYDKGTVTTTIPAAGEQLDSSTVKLGSGGEATWTGTTLSMHYENAGLTMQLHFTDAAVVTNVTCTSDGGPATCAP